MRRIIPNTFTCLNLVSGCIAVRFALMGDAQMALMWIIIGAVFDFFDGFVARLLKAPSPIGVELDSLADCVTFGVAPASLVYSFLSATVPADLPKIVATVLPYFGYVVAAFSALRLAKFNLDERQHTSFIGLPTPANALFWASFLLFAGARLMAWSGGWIVVMAMAVASAWLLVAEIPMFALKFKNYNFSGDNRYRYSLILIAIVLLVAVGPLKAWWIIIACYILMSLMFAGRHK